MDKPVTNEDKCGDCPFLVPYQHPYFHHTAFCWHQMRDLEFYDYWLADCIGNEPDELLITVRNNGTTQPPKSQ
jgi:hypothetical protein